MIKKALRSLGISVSVLPESRLSLAEKMANMTRAFGYDVRITKSRKHTDCKPSSLDQSLIERYIRHGRIPHSPGYNAYRIQFMSQVLSDRKQMMRFREGVRVPDGYGFGLDERCVEYPWFISKASDKAYNYLDAGAALNQSFILNLPKWRNKRLTIITLAPEQENYIEYGVSYQFADLRNIPFREAWFDEVGCISTIEHVGMDNSVFTQRQSDHEHRPNDYETALLEIWRVLKPSGRLLLTVPFGVYENGSWFQQFDAAMLERSASLLKPVMREETFFRYTKEGWQIAQRDDCQECRYSHWPKDPNVATPDDFAANARAVACCIWVKGE